MWVLFSVVLLVQIFLLQVSYTRGQLFPQCADLIFDEAGRLDIQKILYNCSSNIPSPLDIPSMFPNISGGYYPTMVSVQLAINNLIKVDDIGNQLTIDFFFRLRWTDPRWNITDDMWSYVNPTAATSDGIDVLGYISSQEELLVWKPDITFQQVNSFDVVSEMFKMFPRGVFYWSRHVVSTFTQPALDYHSYPSDTQNFSLVIQSYGYSSYFLDTNFINNQAVVLVQNFQNNKANVQQNQLWTYQTYSAYTEDIMQANFANPTRTFSMCLINLLFTRQSDGITVRFLVPLTLLILLSALTYWISYENRIDVTITILVSVSALYIVILQNLPMVGYLTDADSFVFWMFVLLLLVVASHQVYSTLRQKADIWPLRRVYMRCIEITGRVALPLIVLVHFQNTVNYFYDDSYHALLGLLVTLDFILLSRELFGLVSVFDKAFSDVIAKVNDPLTTLKKISLMEAFFINLIMFKRLSVSKQHICRAIETGKHLIYTTKKQSSVWLRNVSLFNELLGKSADSSSVDDANNNRQKRTSSASAMEMHHDVEMTNVFTKSLTMNPLADQEGGVNVEINRDSVVFKNKQQDSDDEA